MQMNLAKKTIIRFCAAALLSLSANAFATETLAYFDTSSSARQYHQNYMQDFEKVVAKAHTGDTFVLSRIDLETHHFAPFGTYTLEKPRKGISAKKKKELAAEMRQHCHGRAY